jgi:hypothetical protein
MIVEFPQLISCRISTKMEIHVVVGQVTGVAVGSGSISG